MVKQPGNTRLSARPQRGFAVRRILTMAMAAGLALASALPCGVAAPITTNLSLWLDASDASTMHTGTSSGSASVTTNGDLIRLWENKAPTGSQYDVLNSGATTSLPRYVTSGLNGRSTVGFDGADFVGNSNLPWGAGFEVFAVVQATVWGVPTSNPGASYILSSNSASSATAGLALGIGWTSQLWFQTPGFVGFTNGWGTATPQNPSLNALYRSGAQGSSGPQIPAGQWVVTDWAMGPSISQIALDGEAMTARVATTGTNAADLGVWLGARNTGALESSSKSQWWNGQMAEILIYDQPLTQAQRDQVNLYLGDKWGIVVVPEPGSLVLSAAACMAFAAAGRGWARHRRNETAKRFRDDS